MTEAWPPTRHTPPLSEHFPSAWDDWANLIDLIWLEAFGYQLELWQHSLLRAALEVYPEGHKRAGQLRFRQVVISLGRQNGKSEVAAALGLWGLLRERMAYVVGIASSREQAELVYKRTLQAITANPALARRFVRMTGTRGIAAKSGSLYELKAAKGAALQGIPVSVAVCDELHILKAELWSALIAGAGARPNTLVAGITTAGDDDSALLLDLYARGEVAATDPDTRLGFYVWEAPEARWPEDDATALEWLMLANPSLASGRLDADAFLDDVKAMPEADRIRYRLNRFTKTSAAFIPIELWLKGARQPDQTLPEGRPIFTIDRTPDWGFATISAAVKDADGIVWTELVTSLVKPTLAQLVAACVELYKFNPQTYVADGYTLQALLDELKHRGLPTYRATLGDVTSASAMFYSLLVRGRLRHADEPLLALQIPRTKRKSVGDGFRISRQDSSIEIDAVMATVLGAYVAETARAQTVQVF